MIIVLDPTTEPRAASYGAVIETILSRREQRLALVRAAARRFQVRYDDVMGDSQQRRVVAARYYAMLLVRAYHGDSFPQIGRLFNRHHSAVMFGLARMFGWRFPRGGARDGLGAYVQQGLDLFGPGLRHEAHCAIVLDNALKFAARQSRQQTTLTEEIRHAA